MTAAFEDFLRGHGFIITGTIPADGEIHRFPHRDKPTKKNGWAIRFDEQNAVFGNWQTNDTHKWQSKELVARKLTPEERRIIEDRRRESIARVRAQKEEQALTNKQSWDHIKDEGEFSPYLQKKRVGNYGLKIDASGNAYMPLRDIAGKLWNYQNISSSPKLFKKGRTGECFHSIEGDREKIVITSGYATAASIHESTGLCVLAAGGDSNIIPVARAIRKRHGKANILIAADNDAGKSESGQKVAAQAKQERFDCVMPKSPGDFNDAVAAGEDIYGYFLKTVPVHNFLSLYSDDAPIPPDIISPRILTPGGMLVFGGAAKVGKSDFLLTWLAHMAAGVPFMEMEPPRPLRIFYLQAEVQYDYLRERVQMIDMTDKQRALCGQNMVITPQVHMVLNEQGVKTIGNTIRQHFRNNPPDIIAIDPIGNVYDQDSENDNAQMLTFLTKRVEALRQYASDKTSFMLVHHTKKIAKEELAKDPFQMFSGASSLRRYYTTGMIMYRPDETIGECVIAHEVRNGPRVPNKRVDKNYGKWVVVDDDHSRVLKRMEDAGDTYSEERQRKVDILTDELRFESERGVRHTIRSYSDYMAGKSGLGSSITVNRLLGEMLAQGDIVLDNSDDTRRRYILAL